MTSKTLIKYFNNQVDAVNWLVANNIKLGNFKIDTFGKKVKVIYTL